ncbi:5-formyltetrahydrofolate cyclo-ligase [Streptococcus danieliae]|uniref:5-formyltetrahydrofolate cyclo-ligase n=1 Tax=Streptococcus danieliae TaxID=747656 RepID=A0A7X3KC91_9STRE|nr:5-formyltetrahydrofolate cyclo-ligase [Streptococcus danieliae]MBF0698961.1 5-formyltetrahydrofolate cyclo-ligase [Streptococcus danieliae]MVX59320.1 5-formyltetrahydrofolate cyclo-ligase [Streptococcus danieliae]NYS32596.1 5-formyltetrahydrofolate cyclo-ligase [Streptococcus danieliae]NYS96138.1 5-formyltetrahydrofolate cyclo-ligase [Streptococcus danieliae]
MKKILRKKGLDLLKQQSPERKALADQRLLEQFLASPAYGQAEVLASYLSLAHEVNTQALLEQARLDGKRLLVPKVVKPGQMAFVDYDPERLQPGAYGILEPTNDPDPRLTLADIDLIHVPGLVFNRAGYRIGYGGGYYDRILTHFPGWTLATIYAVQLADFIPQAHDQAVKELLIDDVSTQI